MLRQAWAIRLCPRLVSRGPPRSTRSYRRPSVTGRASRCAKYSAYLIASLGGGQNPLCECVFALSVVARQVAEPAQTATAAHLVVGPVDSECVTGIHKIDRNHFYRLESVMIAAKHASTRFVAIASRALLP